MAMSDIGVMLGNMVFKGVNHFTSIPVETQEKILMQIVEENKDTEYGKKIGFDKIHSVEDFQKSCGVSSAVIDALYNAGALGDMPKENQISLLG